MTLHQKWIAFCAIVRDETRRILRIWKQILLPPAITSALYFLVFGHVIGQRVGPIIGVPYIRFIMPGLIIMPVIMGAYQNTVSRLFSAKFMRSLEAMLVSPMSYHVIIAGYVVGGVIRGCVSAVVVALIALMFTHSLFVHWFLSVFVILLAATMFSLAGLMNAVFAKSFDEIAIVPTFVLTPMVYLGGVFYSMTMLSPFWQRVSSVNPIFYIVEGFRAATLGLYDTHIMTSVLMMCFFTVVLYAGVYAMLKRGIGIRE